MSSFLAKLCLIGSVAAVSCRSGARLGAEPDSSARTALLAAEPHKPEVKAMDEVNRGKLPTDLDVRVERALALPAPAETVLEFLMVGRTKRPVGNYRWALTADGNLFYVQHSGGSGDWQVPFDRPLPARPVRTISASEVTALLDRLAAAGFFVHPAYEANPQVDGGEYQIVRARRGADRHTVVYENVSPPLAAELAALTDTSR